jgi:serine protease inhibitor
MKLIFLFLLAICLFTGCNRESVSPAVTDITLTSQSAKIVKTDNQFGLELFQNINFSLEGQSNVMISPMSVSIALAMVYNGAEGDTKTQIEGMLHKSGLTVDEINRSYKDLVENLASHDPKVELKLADAIFYRNDFSVKPDFITAIRPSK